MSESLLPLCITNVPLTGTGAQRLVDIKGLFSKRNLLPSVVAAGNLIKTTNGYKLKVETTVYYMSLSNPESNGTSRCQKY